jgi:hypothetical protein
MSIWLFLLLVVCPVIKRLKKQTSDCPEQNCEIYIYKKNVGPISSVTCTRDIENRVKQLRLEHVHKFYNKCPTYQKDSVTSTRKIKNRVKQLRLEHVHKFYNKCPTYLKDSVRPPEI